MIARGRPHYVEGKGVIMQKTRAEDEVMIGDVRRDDGDALTRGSYLNTCATD